MKPASVLVITVLLLTTAFGQEQAPKPGPELQKLNYFIGSWTSEGEMKPGPMGPGGKVSIKEEASWMDGGFFVVFRSTFKSVMGDGTAVAYMGYDPQERMYTYDEYNSAGQVVHAKGNFDGDTLIWNNEMKMGPQTMKARFTQKMLSSTSYSYKFEMSPDGTTWNLVMDGKDTKNK